MAVIRAEDFDIDKIEKSPYPKRSDFIDLVGMEFNYLTVKLYAGRYKKHSTWWCQCVCGNWVVVRSNQLKSNDVISCGCKALIYKRENLKSHGMSRTPTHRSWSSMLSRCKSTNPERYRYSGRGIKVCQGWQVFDNFFADMGERPSKKYSIDRIDNDMHYSCGHCEECLENGWIANCRWATQKEQNRNKSTNRLYTYKDKTQCIMDWAEEYGADKSTVAHRLYAGWDIERALTQPLRKSNRDDINLTQAPDNILPS